MQIFLNGAASTFDEGSTIAAVVQRLELAGRRTAVEVNEEIVPRSQYAEFRLNDGDRVEVVHAVGGG